MTSAPADLAAIRAAAVRIEPHVHRTPLLECASIDTRAGRKVWLKAENLQKGGAFKARGANNAVWRLSEEEARRGVVTHSSGNHAQALARAARSRGIPCHVVMPLNAPAVKRKATLAYGAIVHDCEPTQAAREAGLRAVVAETGCVPIPPFDHPDVIAGQGTVALEILEQHPAVEAILAPVGGGGLVAGVALCVAELSASTRVFAVEPAGADDAYRSKRDGRRYPQTDPHTIADGLRTGVGELTWPVLRDRVESVIRVDDREIVAAMRLLYERAKLVVEPSGAVSLAGVLSSDFDPERRIGEVAVVISGGNVELDAFFAALP